jgi:hypothetical protein
MASIIVIAGDKGGSGKTTTSHAICHGLALYGIPAFQISTDARREILPPENCRYATLDGRDPKALGALVDKLNDMDRTVAVIDGGGGRPEVDAILSQVANLTILPIMQSQTDLRVARADLDRLDGAVGLPNRWPTSKWAREVADKELADELGGYTARLMSPIPEINGLRHAAEGVPSGLAPKCTKTTMRGISQHCRNHYIW